ncbi:MAG TPA: outer membrane lipoprotein chaperone LolA [Longimicrobiales bacterium]
MSGIGVRWLGMLMVAAVACSDAADSAREGVEDGYETTSPDSAPGDSGVIDQIPYFPADGGAGEVPNTSASPIGGASSPGTAPAGPAGSSSRTGGGVSGGDDLGGGSAAPARSTSQTDEILARAARAYSAIRTLRADFDQTTENPVLRRSTTSRGTVYQSRPDRFAMRFSQPQGDVIVADGQYIWVYYPSVDEEQVIRMRAVPGGAGAVDLQAQFLGDPTERFNAVHNGTEAVGGREADVLTLTPRAAANFRSLKVWVDRGDALVRRFEITEHNGVIRRFVLRNLTPGADIDAAVFRFTPPEGAHIVARG